MATRQLSATARLGNRQPTVDRPRDADHRARGALIVAVAASSLILIIAMLAGEAKTSRTDADSVSATSDPASAQLGDTSVVQHETVLADAVQDLVGAYENVGDKSAADSNTADLVQQIRDRDPLFGTVGEVTVIDQALVVSGDVVDVTLTLHVNIGGEIIKTTRQWHYEPSNDRWSTAKFP